MELYLQQRLVGRAPPPYPALAPGPDRPDQEPPEELGGFGVGVGPGWEFSRASFWWRRHLLLQSEVAGTNPKVKFMLFCCRCGAVSSDGKLTTSIPDWCYGRVHLARRTCEKWMSSAPSYRRGQHGRPLNG